MRKVINDRLNETERSVLRVIKSYQQRYHNSPTIQEIADELHMEPALVQYTASKLQEKFYIDMESPRVSNRLMIVPLRWE